MTCFVALTSRSRAAVTLPTAPTGDLTRRLDEVQHDYTDEIVSTMHVHLDHHNCLEILALKGRGKRVYELADRLLGLRGVKHGELTCAATGQSLEL